MCELLRKNPHPNIAVYYGYQETNGRVSGLCFKRYMSTLLEAVNPGYLGKEMFQSSSRELVTVDVKASLEGVLAAVQHLHGLGIVHNDINPANVMLDEEGRMALIDFASCRFVGESLRGARAKRTHHWHDPTVEVSVERNDLDAFRDLKVWLCGEVGEGLLFE